MPKRFLLIIFVVLISYLSLFSSTVKLEVLSHPSGADIFINRVWRGTTPQVLYIAPGKHQIQLEKFGYSPSMEGFDLKLSSIAEYNLTPEREITKHYPLVTWFWIKRASIGISKRSIHNRGCFSSSIPFGLSLPSSKSA